MANDLYFSQASIDFSDFASHPTFGATRTYLEHQIACDLFGQYDERPFLFRSDLAEGDSGTILLLSTVPPEVPGPDAATYGFTRELRTTEFPSSFQPGTELDFEIRLNATKDVPRGPGKSSKRVDIWEHSRRRDPTASRDAVYGRYLEDRLAPAASVLSAHVTERSFLKISRKGQGKDAIRFVATNVIGTLTVNDADGFVKLLSAGIGRSRGFGCGLFCLSRPGTVLPRRYPTAMSALAT